MDPLAASDGDHGVCVNGTALNSTTIGLLRQRYRLPATGGDPNVVQWFLTPSVNAHSPADLRTFQGLYGLPAQNVTLGCAGWSSTGSGCAYVGRTGLEADLDAQYMSAASPRTTTLEQTFSESDDDTCKGPSCWLGDLVECAAQQCAMGRGQCSYDPCFGKPAPSVVSMSWGVPQIDMPPAQALIFNQHAAHLALLGVTLVAASGDGGAAGIYEQGTDDDSSTHEQICGNSYQPLFPAASPFVTAVGATQGVEAAAQEAACSAGAGGGITTGGGFSEIEYAFSTQQWMTPHVVGYLSSSIGKAAQRGYFQRGSNGWWAEGSSYDDYSNEPASKRVREGGAEATRGEGPHHHHHHTTTTTTTLPPHHHHHHTTALTPLRLANPHHECLACPVAAAHLSPVRPPSPAATSPPTLPCPSQLPSLPAHCTAETPSLVPHLFRRSGRALHSSLTRPPSTAPIPTSA